MREFIQSRRPTLFDSLFQGYEGLPFSIRLWDGWSWHSRAEGEPACTIVFRSREALLALVSHPKDITLGEAFLAKDIDVEADLFSAFAVTEFIFQCPRGQRQRLLEFLSGTLFAIHLWWKQGKRHSTERDRMAISHHFEPACRLL